MKPTRSSIALICLTGGLLLYPLGLYLSKQVSQRDVPAGLNPWGTNVLHDVLVPLPAAIPAALILIGCGLSLEILVNIARREGVRAMFRVRRSHLWLGVLILAYIVVAFITVGVLAP